MIPFERHVNRKRAHCARSGILPLRPYSFNVRGKSASFGSDQAAFTCLSSLIGKNSSTQPSNRSARALGNNHRALEPAAYACLRTFQLRVCVCASAAS